MRQSLAGRRVLLIIAGGIAAYKSLDLIRRLRERGAAVRVVMTRSAEQFVAPLAAASLSEDRVYTDLFSLTDESEMGHIRLSREADLLLVAPATADILARMAAGMAGDLATTTLLATDKPVMVAPAMNVRMWDHPATQANMTLLRSRGVLGIGPAPGDLACGEVGSGRMAEPLEIVAAVEQFFAGSRTLEGRHLIVTSGPTYEPIDPVRFLGNRSSGKQGHAIAGALAARGARVTLVTGPSDVPTPAGVSAVRVGTAIEMLAAVQAALPADAAICAAAVSDWRVARPADRKLKKRGEPPPTLELVDNPDILAILAAPGPARPLLVVGFAAETDHLIENATAKRAKKNCDWILANDVGDGAVFGQDDNQLTLLTETGSEDWGRLPKAALAARLADRIAAFLG